MDASYLSLILSLPGILLGLTLHELAHAYVAYKCGDHTAKSQWRLTLNPIKHIDPLGFLFIIFAWFGWAKPVEINDRNLKNPRSDEIKIALAGPITNVIIALVFTGIFWLYALYFENMVIASILLYTIYINWWLFFFNMIPIPPLDGSHVFFGNIKETNPELYTKIYTFWTMGLFIALLIDSQTWLDIIPIGSIVRYWWDFFLSFVVNMG